MAAATAAVAARVASVIAACAELCDTAPPAPGTVDLAAGLEIGMAGTKRSLFGPVGGTLDGVGGAAAAVAVLAATTGAGIAPRVASVTDGLDSTGGVGAFDPRAGTGVAVFTAVLFSTGSSDVVLGRLTAAVGGAPGPPGRCW